MNIVEKIIEVLKTEDRLTNKEIVTKIIKRFPNNKECSIKKQLENQTKRGLLKKEYIGFQYVYSLVQDTPIYVAGRKAAIVTPRATDRLVGCYTNGKLVASRVLRYPSAISLYKSLCKQYFGECTFKEFADLKAIPLMKTLRGIALTNRHAGIQTFQTDIQRATNWFINSTGNQIDLMLKNEGIPKYPTIKSKKK